MVKRLAEILSEKGLDINFQYGVKHLLKRIKNLANWQRDKPEMASSFSTAM